MKIKCPICGRENETQPHPTQEGWVILLCVCNPIGPVLETDAPVKKEKVK